MLANSVGIGAQKFGWLADAARTVADGVRRDWQAYR